MELLQLIPISRHGDIRNRYPFLLPHTNLGYYQGERCSECCSLRNIFHASSLGKARDRSQS
ncbi:hypothetical protein K440DRAFT_611934 [Wilcoxina mikolae CBS 423.85]|nr:hypothetical protein K440DRAFT_611934 [Wilcoxina mikolae CBS 423.85]